MTSCCRRSGAPSTVPTRERSRRRPAGGGAAAASRLVELAHHWTAAHEPARALAAAIEAGEASRAAYAYADAARQYERAIELWDIVPVVDRPADRDLADLYDAASSAATLVGDAARAVTPGTTRDRAGRWRRWGWRRSRATGSRAGAVRPGRLARG